MSLFSISFHRLRLSPSVLLPPLSLPSLSTFFPPHSFFSSISISFTSILRYYLYYLLRHYLLILPPPPSFPSPSSLPYFPPFFFETTCTHVLTLKQNSLRKCLLSLLLVFSRERERERALSIMGVDNHCLEPALRRDAWCGLMLIWCIPVGCISTIITMLLSNHINACQSNQGGST